MQARLSGYTAVIGIDWADKKHDVCVRSMSLEERWFERIPHQVDKIDDFVRRLRRRYGGPMAVALELSKGPLVTVLQKYDCFDIYPINPSALASYRETFHPSGAKDDPSDAELALDILLRHSERFEVLTPQSKEMRSLMSMVEHRRRLVDDRVRLTNRLRSTLKQYYPQALEWFERLDTRLFCAFMRRWPTLRQARGARVETLKKFFHEHHMYRQGPLDRRLKAIKSASALTRDNAVIVPYRLQALTLVDQLDVTLASIKRYDDAIASLAPQHPDYPLFSTLPGAGPSLAPRLLVAFGEQRERFTNAAEVQKYSGIAPVTERSGQKAWVHWRWQCSTFLRQTFIEWSAQTIRRSYWAGLYYRQQRAKGATYQAAIRALAFKWIRILYRCWASRKAYDESHYLKALQRSGSPLLVGEKLD